MSTHYILGIQSFANRDSGICILSYAQSGALLDYIAISEERLSRQKNQYVFPLLSLKYCMDYFGLQSLEQIDHIVTDYIRLRRWFISGPTYNIGEFDYLKIKWNIDPRKIHIISHHMAHAASTYYTSGYDRAAILVVDGNGSDVETTSYFLGKESSITLLENYKYHGIGSCYSVVTNTILNFGVGEEGKTMGLAPYGKDYPPVLKLHADLKGIKNDFSSLMRRQPYSDVLNHINIPDFIYPLRKKYRRCENTRDVLSPYFSRVAYEIQLETERVMLHLAKDLYFKTKEKNLCIAGGVGLNAVANKVLLDKSGFKNVYIFPACSDSGIPFGLAMWGYQNLVPRKILRNKPSAFKHVFFGKTYSDASITQILRKYQLPYTTYRLQDIAKFIADGAIVAWFQGGSEYGPRALGHRSILTDSRYAQMKDILNIRVKHRESFRPYGASVLSQYASDYFDMQCESPYMLMIAKVKKLESIPAVTHVDNTVRIQTITKAGNGIYYQLIDEFYKITGIPCILNTSLNVAGEPIAETPEDAICIFLTAPIDYLVIENYLISSRAILHGKKILKTILKSRSANLLKEKNIILKKFFPGYNTKQRDYFIAESNKQAEWYTRYKCKYELEKKVHEWIEKKRKILIIGTKEHTAILRYFINGFFSVNVAGFIEYKKREYTLGDAGKIYRVPYRKLRWSDLRRLRYDELLISSFDYNFEILELIKEKFSERSIYAIYDNTSRSFFEVVTGLPKYPSY